MLEGCHAAGRSSGLSEWLTTFHHSCRYTLVCYKLVS